MSGLILQYAFNYTDQHRPILSKFTEMMPLANYLDRQNLVNDFANYAARYGLRRRNLMIMRSHSLLQNYIDSRIIYNILDEQAWIEYLNLSDETVKAALDVFKNHTKYLAKPRHAPARAVRNTPQANRR